MNENEDEARTKSLQAAIDKGSWDDRLFVETERRASLLIRNVNFLSRIQAIRDKYITKPELLTDTLRFKLQWDINELRSQHFAWDNEVTQLLADVNLMQGWRASINTYILTNEMIAPAALHIHDTPNTYGVAELQIIIQDQAALKDMSLLNFMMKHWTGVHGYKTKLRRRPFPHMAYYLEMYDLKLTGLSNDTIAKVLNEKYEGDDSAPPFTEKFVYDSLTLLDKEISQLL